MEAKASPANELPVSGLISDTRGLSVLMIARESGIADYWRSLSEQGRFHLEEVTDGFDALLRLEEREFTFVVVCDDDECDGREALIELVERRPSLPVYSLSRLKDGDILKRNSNHSVADETGVSEGVFFGDSERAVEALDVETAALIQASCEGNTEEKIKRAGLGELVGVSSAMQRVYKKIHRASQADCVVLLQGESGTGKELAARAVHGRSIRRDNPFIPVNCSAIPDNLIESELFGYKRGAFSGAVANTQGILRTASGGTVFFDEIGELSLGLQAKLLRFVEDKTVKPLGSNKSYRIDVRIIVATNVDLREEMDRGGFRKDLFYRINVLPIYMPPLREKKEDIPILVDHFLRKYGRSGNMIVRGVSSEVLSSFFQYSWPGNVREMENTLQQAIVMGSGPLLSMDNLPHGFASARKVEEVVSQDLTLPTIRKMEEELIKKALAETEGNVAAAARLLGVDRKTVYRKMKRFSALA